MNNPVLITLASAIHQKKLSRSWFMRIIDRREKELFETHFKSIKDLEEHGEKIHSSFIYLSLESLGIRNVEADHVASHIGKAVTISTRLRAAPFHASRKLCFLPRDLMAKHGASEENVFRGENGKELEEVAYEVSSIGFAHLKHAREIGEKVKGEAKLAFLPAIVATEYFNSLQKANFNLFDPSLSFRKGISLPLKLYWHKLNGTF